MSARPLPIPAPSRIAALALAGGAGAALALAGLPEPLAALAALLWTALGWPLLGPWALVAAAPAAALPLGGGAPALAGWTAAAAAAGGALAAALAAQRRSAAQVAQESLRELTRNREALRRAAGRYPALLDACLELSAARDLDRFAAVLCARARALLPEADDVRVLLGRPGQLGCPAACGEPAAACARSADADAAYVAAEGRPLLRRAGGRLRCLLPLGVDGRGDGMRGVLAASLPSGGITARADLDQLAALARIGGLGLAAVELVGQARSLALHDDLTGLFGRHEFLRRLDEQVALARRHELVLGVAMCDLDHLKAYNDRFGHAAGDAALRAVAAALRAALPDGTAACRWGGEEFAFLAPGYGEAALLALAEQVRAAIAAAEPEPEAGDRRITASLGCAVVRPDESPAAAMVRADAACYRAKAAGRDRVASADDLPSVVA